MKRLNTVPMRFFATLLLILCAIPASAQYYLNIRQTDGTRLRYAVSAVDSLWFDKDEHQEPSVNYKYVDLGLSVKWATFNVGASKPEEYGDYYAWGETEPHYEAGYAQEDPQTHWKDGYTAGYNWSTYKYCNDSNNSMTKYCSNSSYGNGGFTDTKTTLDLVDDVAHVKWGGSWRMPTRAEQDELRNNCTWTWITQNGVNGYLVTSKKSGYEGASIFLPAAGCRDGLILYGAGSEGYYWSSSLYTDYPHIAWRLFWDSTVRRMYRSTRYWGFSVRPVYPSDIVMKLNAESVSLKPDDEITLTTVVEIDGQEVDFKVQWSSDNPEVATVSADGVVMCLSEGTALITAEYYGHTATCQLTVTKPDGTGYEYVDLGLSVKWATFNVGSTAPEENGDYFAWGETKPYYKSGFSQEDPQAHWKDSKSNGYDWLNYKYCNGSSSYTMTKYCNDSKYGYDGFTDTKTTLDPDDDVAHVKWGGDWRMPTQAEFNELLDNCTWTWTTQNDVKGYLVTSNKSGHEGASIFLPAAGYRYDTSLTSVGSGGLYWSSSLFEYYSNRAWYLNFNTNLHFTYSSFRISGFSVRPVCPSDIVMKLNAESVLLNTDDEITLTAVVEKDDQEVDFKVQWSSDNPEVASVSDDGVVKGLSEGTALITAEYYGHTVTCQVTVTKQESVSYEYVDLGLSVKWATFNVGATKPEEYGDYFAWGMTEPYHEAGYFLGDYDIADNNTTLDPEDDVARVKWGGDWRMPTQAELEELINTDNCTWTWTTLNGVNGYLVTSKKSGHQGASIFLPAAGYRNDTSLDDAGSIGYYWSSSLATSNSELAFRLGFSSDVIGRGGGYCGYGLSVRPVCP